MELAEREYLIPVDVDWTMEMSDEIARYLLKEKKNIDGMFAPMMGVQIISIVNKHMKANNYKLTHGNH